ncbi:Uncharacterized protein PECH_002153 [Penicillium ucsense]|uniref:Glycolipid transfer protein domain-containing protein n=1 Tax=Penicillium ucsense TaxID=2839758 RepID=A0A8J8VW27_9EURO|nr:Uncharacterized protein PECM_002889 [Penicillium ucsense]KAF7731291.1 Uncharacterized protein PECH_002153 [Penicillium ucsense]
MSRTNEVHAPGTWFSSIPRSFEEVPIDTANGNAISTVEFLEAAGSLVTLFDVIGGVGLAAVKSDLTGNITKVQERYNKAPAESQTLQDLVRNELKSGQHKATEGLLWLVRGLQFTASALRLSLNNPSEELNASFLGAYKAPGGLSTHHGYIIRKGTEVAIKSGVPYRKDFYNKLGENQAEVNVALEKEVKALENVVTILLQFQSTPEAQWK